MKNALIIVLLASLGLNGQGLINEVLHQEQLGHTQQELMLPQCGSHFLMMDDDRKLPGYREASDKALLQTAKEVRRSHKTTNTVLNVPVVFHIVYNDSTENLPDSVIFNQLQSLNDNFSRNNADTSTLRSEFLPYAGNPNIEFELASVDPDGNPTSGIVRKYTPIEYFGGTLPYNQNQVALIQQWVEDSLFLNYSRLSADSLGGSSPWDTERYLNIWIGDLRIFEPQINNFEELVFLGFARPPANHPHFAGTGIDSLLFHPGAIMHYVAIGPNNPNNFPTPYGNFNTICEEGDLLSHEVGHFLALRHIWGDGDCTADDFISDTPLSNNSNQFTCNKFRNSCLDSIGGMNLPDMVENFMDYSSDACLNSFTQVQSLVMRNTLLIYFPGIPAVGTPELSSSKQPIKCYPNPTSGLLTIEASESMQGAEVQVFTMGGQMIQESEMPQSGSLDLQLTGPSGLYFIRIKNDTSLQTIKVLMQ